MNTPDPIDLFDARTELERFRQHVVKYRREYTIGALGLAAGLYFGKKFRKAPILDANQIINIWLTEMHESGTYVYGLNKRQHELWQVVVDYVAALADHDKVTMNEAATHLVREFSASIKRME